MFGRFGNPFWEVFPQKTRPKIRSKKSSEKKGQKANFSAFWGQGGGVFWPVGERKREGLRLAQLNEVLARRSGKETIRKNFGI